MYKYLEASIWSGSVIRRSIKKAMSEYARSVSDLSIEHRPGALRATFEDNILLLDILFLQAWVPVELQKFCTTVTTMHEKSDDTWRIHTTREVREALPLSIPTTKEWLDKEMEQNDLKLDAVRISRAL